MARHGWLVRCFAAAFLATVAACSGDRFDATDTLIQGIIFLPEPDRCADCSSTTVPVTILVLKQGEGPSAIDGGTTTSRSVYRLQLDPADPATAAADSNGDGKQAVVAIASVNSTAAIGGVFSARAGATSSKDFSPTTHVACVASVFLTAGNTAAELGCTVADECQPGDPECFPIIDPDTLDTARIGNLEGAASFISPDVNFPSDQGQAACAVIVCTQGGNIAASEDCVRSRFEGGSPRD